MSRRSRSDTGSRSSNNVAVTRCVCCYRHDDESMVCCDSCNVWQHIVCFDDIDQDNIPDVYLCERCKPRPVNALKAMRIQDKKARTLARRRKRVLQPHPITTPAYTRINTLDMTLVFFAAVF
eukprot:gene7929-10022_t